MKGLIAVKMKKVIPAVLTVLLFIMSASVPASGFHAKTNGYGYSRECFYSKPYIFDICRDITSKDAKALESKTVVLSDNTSQKIWYDDSIADYMDDKDVTDALADVLSRIKAEDSSMSRPMVLSVKNAGNASPEKLAERYYNKGDIDCFGAVYPFADSKTRKAYLKKAYDDDRTDFFSVSLNCLCDDALTESYGAKAFEDDNTAVFSICLDALDDSGNTAFAETYTEKAYYCDKADFFAILTDDLSDRERKVWYNRACRDDKTSIKAVCRCDDTDDCDDDYDDYYGCGENKRHSRHHHGHNSYYHHGH